MILQISDTVKSSWVYWDKISRVSVTRCITWKKNADNPLPEYRFFKITDKTSEEIFPDALYVDFSNQEYRDADGNGHCICCTVEREGFSETAVVFNAGYLLNDEGKTIERL